jgi:hypothetical protein
MTLEPRLRATFRYTATEADHAATLGRARCRCWPPRVCWPGGARRISSGWLPWVLGRLCAQELERLDRYAGRRRQPERSAGQEIYHLVRGYGELVYGVRGRVDYPIHAAICSASRLRGAGGRQLASRSACQADRDGAVPASGALGTEVGRTTGQLAPQAGMVACTGRRQLGIGRTWSGSAGPLRAAPHYRPDHTQHAARVRLGSAWPPPRPARR